MVTATVNALPSAPTGIDVTACSDGSAHTGSATVGTGQSVVWYTLASGGSVTTAPSRTGVGSSSAYAAAKITATGCESATRTLVTVTINPLPSQYTVTGGGTFCSTQSGVAVGLSGSQTGVSYQLKKDGVDTGSPVSGSGTAITFGNQTAAGTYTVLAKNTTTYCTQTMIGNATVTVTATTVTVTPNPKQYSDKVTFVATLSPSTILPTGSAVDFYVGSQKVGTATLAIDGTATLADVVLLEPSPFGTAPTGQMAPGPHTVTAKFGAPTVPVCDPTTTLTIAQEDAIATYTGSLFVATPTTNATTATVTLSATIQDITAVTPAYDAYAGDIRKATVTFVVDGLGGGSFSAAIGLVSTADTKVGTVTTNVSLGLGDHTVTVVVSGYYTNAAGNDENTVVEVAQTGQGQITGGGYLIATSASSGITPAAPGTKNNFGFNVQNTKTGLKGSINTIVRNNGRVYQIKGNSMTSLTVNTAITTNPPHPYPTAVFNGKANIQDITNPLAPPISIDGNATLTVTMTDKGEPGSSDSIGITLYNKSGGVWYTSYWSGTQTVEQTIGGGNLVVH